MEAASALVGEDPVAEPARHVPRAGFLGLAMGSIGVVFGDIGTSPIYAMRETLAHVKGGADQAAVLGVVSLIFWALTLIVTVKYLIVVMRADNKGEGGTLAMMALAQKALGRRSLLILSLGVCGAALFYGDGLITPAISVLSAVEGLKGAPHVGHLFTPFVLPAAAGVLIALFLAQSRGTAAVGRFFGPITLIWFLALAGLGAMHILRAPGVVQGLNPVWGLKLLTANLALGFAILGSVFLVVTGAEALYADIGHFGKGPIRFAWLAVAFPCLLINYLGQGALVLVEPSAAADPFFRMIPGFAYWPMLILTTAATVIASQAVITGAYSVSQQAMQLGLLPRLDIRRTSESVAGQIFVPQINTLLMVGVLALLVIFRSSSNLAAAYGIAVTGTMVITVLLLSVIARRHWKWPLAAAAALTLPFLVIDGTFLAANAMKFAEGGWFPVALGGGLVLVMWTWTRGSQALFAKSHRDSIDLNELIAILSRRPPRSSPGTAVFLTSDASKAPVALTHNLKHNNVLHEQNIIMTIRTAETPRVPEAHRVKLKQLSPAFIRVVATYGFMEQPNVLKALADCRRLGLKFDIMSTSFFLGRRTVTPSAHSRLPAWQHRLFVYLMRNAANPTDFYHIPPGRVVEMGAQVLI